MKLLIWAAERGRDLIDALAVRGIEPAILERLDLALVRWLCDCPEIGR